jgi:hypothetical protein
MHTETGSSKSRVTALGAFGNRGILFTNQYINLNFSLQQFFHHF